MLGQIPLIVFNSHTINFTNFRTPDRLSGPGGPTRSRGRERLARYIPHAPFSQKKITIVCESRKSTADGVSVLPGLDWLAGLVTHLPDKGQQLVRSYRHYSNVCQGRKKRETGVVQPAASDVHRKDDSFRKQCTQQLGAADKENLRRGSSRLPKVSGPDEDHLFPGGPGSRQENSGSLETVGCSRTLPSTPSCSS